jgi:N-acetyl sugar amidotransferase
MNIDFLSEELEGTSEQERKCLSQKVDIVKKYKLPTEVKFCTKCVISNQRPRISFDDEGVCSSCRYWERKGTSIDWESREKELQELCDKYRRDDGRFDVIVGSSGGKDSVYVAYELKNKYNMHPLMYNFQAHIHSGMDNICVTANGLVHRKMTRISTIEIGDPFQPFIYGQTYLPLKLAEAFDIPLIMDGENGEAEYGGDPSADNSKGFSLDEVVDYWLSDFPLDFWYDYGFERKDLELYYPPAPEKLAGKDIERHFFSYYRDWRPNQHYKYCVKTGFKVNPEGRSESTYSNYASLDDLIDPFHYYFALLKFGIGRTTSDAAHEVREDIIDRDEGVRLVKRFDEEPPSNKSFEIFTKYTNMTEQELYDCFDKWRNDNVWEKKGDKYELKYPIWKENS